MKILFLGDIHSNLRYLEQVVKKFNFVDAVVQVGDLGLYFNEGIAKSDKDYKRFPNEINTTLQEKRRIKKPVYFCKGNHEDWEFLTSKNLNYLNYFYQPNGTVLELNGLTIGFLGGIYSPKKFNLPSNSLIGNHKRFFTREDIDKLKEHNKLDILITHICPSGIHSIPLVGKVPFLKELLDHLNPQYHFHGHHHFNYSTKYKNTTIVGLGLHNYKIETL